MSALIYAGSMQYVSIGLITGGATFLTMAITTLMDNAHHLFYSISMIDRYKNSGKWKLKSRRARTLASFTEQWTSTGNHVPAVTGLVCTIERRNIL